MSLGERGRHVVDVLIDLGRGHDIEGAVWKGQWHRHPGDEGDGGRTLPGLLLARDREHAFAGVDSVDGATRPDSLGHLDGEEPWTGPDIKHVLAFVQLELADDDPALLHDIGSGVGSFDPARHVVIELKSAHLHSLPPRRLAATAGIARTVGWSGHGGPGRGLGTTVVRGLRVEQKGRAMPYRSVVVRPVPSEPPTDAAQLPKAVAEARRLSEAVRAIEVELELPVSFSPEVLSAAEEAAANPKLPDLDRTDIGFLTIDPAGAKDLDQALHIERADRGFRVHYAIADVAAFVEPGGVIDAEAHRRGQTLYAPDHRISLHPPALSEGAASLLPGQLRPALLWTIDLDETGEQVKVDVRRARVQSRQQLTYDEAQRIIDGPNPPEVLALLKEVGLLRLARERERGGISLPLPDQEVVVADHRWELSFRAVLPVEDWNAQISLLTGMGPGPRPEHQHRCRDAQCLRVAASRRRLRRFRRRRARAHRPCRHRQ
jgi:hypothetical protein